MQFVDRTVADVIVFFYLWFYSFSTKRRWSCTTRVLTTQSEVSFYLGSLSTTRTLTPFSLPRSRSYLANQMAKGRPRSRRPWDDLSESFFESSSTGCSGLLVIYTSCYFVQSRFSVRTSEFVSRLGRTNRCWRRSWRTRHSPENRKKCHCCESTQGNDDTTAGV